MGRLRNTGLGSRVACGLRRDMDWRVPRECRLMHSLLGIAALIGLITLAFGQRAAVALARAVLILAGSGAAWVAYMIATRVLT